MHLPRYGLSTAYCREQGASGVESRMRRDCAGSSLLCLFRERVLKKKLHLAASYYAVVAIIMSIRNKHSAQGSSCPSSPSQ